MYPVLTRKALWKVLFNIVIFNDSKYKRNICNTQVVKEDRILAASLNRNKQNHMDNIFQHSTNITVENLMP